MRKGADRKGKMHRMIIVNVGERREKEDGGKEKMGWKE